MAMRVMIMKLGQPTAVMPFASTYTNTANQIRSVPGINGTMMPISPNTIKATTNPNVIDSNKRDKTNSL
jgi:hypothetical protein